MKKLKNQSFLRTLGKTYLWLFIIGVSIGLLILPWAIGYQIKSYQPLWGYLIILPTVFHIIIRSGFYLYEIPLNDEEHTPAFFYKTRIREEIWALYRSSIVMIALITVTGIFCLYALSPILLMQYTGQKLFLLLYTLVIPTIIAFLHYSRHYNSKN